MKMAFHWILSIWFFLFSTTTALPRECPEQFLGKCFCGQVKYQERVQYVLNCTNARFETTDMLEHMPDQTQVLIFTGNSIAKLPWNVFGASKNYTKLRVIDFSNNEISEILGKSFHGVASVERLILNHNKISLTNKHLHPRMFSNFINLLELHLTDAFEDNSEHLASDLHDIFYSSDLKHLVKLHLEQNEISLFKYRSVFCELKNLMDLHLGQNLLQNLNFDLLCLPNLRFVDLESNKITKLTTNELAIFDKFIERNQSLAIDLSGNPFMCDCDIPQFYTWLQNTKVSVRNKEQLRCLHGNPEDNNGKAVINLRKVVCNGQLKSSAIKSQTTTVLLAFTTILLICILAATIYYNRHHFRKQFDPILNTVSRKVYYTSIGKQDDHEVEV